MSDLCGLASALARPNNYDVTDIHCTAPIKKTRLKGWGSPELALEIRKKNDKNHEIAIF